MVRNVQMTICWRRYEFVKWMLAVAIAVAASQAMAQQDEGPILRPKKPPAKPTGATLLVMCDLACNWKLDGEAKGRIDAGGSAKMKVEFGQHVVNAVTEDSLDKVEEDIEIKTTSQTVMHIVLQPIRNARLKAEQQARDKVDQEAREKVAQEERDRALRAQQEKERKEHEQAAQERQEEQQKERERAARAEATGLVWFDTTTGLIWTKKDNGRNVNWHDAIDYCGTLKLAGYSDWRLPVIDELQSIYVSNAKDRSANIKGNLQLSGGRHWSSKGSFSGYAWTFNFGNGKRYYYPLESSLFLGFRALCVRGSGE